MHPLATREALDRFISALPAGHARLRDIATTTRALFAAAVDERGDAPPSAPFADHNLGLLVADALTEVPGDAGVELHFAVRRRLAGALARDPDDLSPALALARGASECIDRPQLRFADRLAEDLAAVASALGRPHAGPRLAMAALDATLRAARHRDAAVAAAAAPMITPVRDAIARLSSALPNHPDLLVARARLHLVEAGLADDPAAALPALSAARGLLEDFTRRYGLANVQRDLLAELIAERARLRLGGADVRDEAVALLTLDVQEALATPTRTRRVVRSLSKVRALDAATARELLALLGLDTKEAARESAWDEVRALLLEALGDDKALLQLAETTLAKDPKHGPSARRLFERWLANIRRDLPAPFSAETADRVLSALPPAALARLGSDELAGTARAIARLFDSHRAFRFIIDAALDVRELRGRDTTWTLALSLAEAVGADIALAELGAKVGDDKVPAAVRLAGARGLVETGGDAALADRLLRGLKGLKGSEGKEVQALQARLRSDPALREAQREQLVAFEEKVGVGSGKPLELKVIYTSPSYALAELRGEQAPDCYDHRYLRTMLRDDDLPEGTAAKDLQKGDRVVAPLRGQDANQREDKGGLRVYWVSDRSRVAVERQAEGTARAEKSDTKAAPTGAAEKEDQVDPRTLEAHFGVGGEAPLEIRVEWDHRKKRLQGRLFDAERQRFPAIIRIAAESLPEGLEPQRLGRKGKRFLGLVVAVDEGGRRFYRVEGPLTLVAVQAGKADDADSGADGAETDALVDAGDDTPDVEVSIA